MKNPVFNLSDTGCYSDGALGDDHLRSRLADLLDVYFPDEHTHFIQPGIWQMNCPACIRETLMLDSSDDSEEVYKAVELLQSLTADNTVWILEAGDLLLVDREQHEHFYG